MNAEHKPTLRYLCTCYGVDAPMLLQRCRVHPSIVWAVLFDYSAPESVVSQILDAFNTLKGTTYTLDDIQIRRVQPLNEEGRQRR